VIKRTIEISSAPTHVTSRLKQLVLERDGATIGSIPCEDLGVVVVDHPQTTYTHAALASLVESDAVMVICGRNHLPHGILLPLTDHSQVVWRIAEQVAISKPLQKRLWQQIVRAKVLAQAGNLPRDSAAYRKLAELARQVRSGDPTNIEAQAARIYWSAWLDTPDDQPPPEFRDFAPAPFRRDPDGDGINSLLNYGYAILRAAVARVLVASGLLPALGLHHSNRSNAFCLADDLLEPLRPLVDERVRELKRAGGVELTPTTKSALLSLLTLTVRYDGQTGPLLVSLHRYVASLVNCFQGTAESLEIPTRC
jgi:CRISPR-associated protein Cas1